MKRPPAYRGRDWKRLGGSRWRIGPFDYTPIPQKCLFTEYIYGMEENVDIGKSTRDAPAISTYRDALKGGSQVV